MTKILAIDDKMDNLVTLSALLKNLMPGGVVITAQSGMEGIAKAKAEKLRAHQMQQWLAA